MSVMRESTSTVTKSWFTCASKNSILPLEVRTRRMCQLPRNNQLWRPRDGLLLERAQGPGQLEKMVREVLEKAPDLLFKPWLAIIVGFLIAVSGPHDLEIRSFGFLLVAIWLCIDVWAWILRRSTVWKFVIGWTATSIVLICVLGVMWWLIDGRLREQRIDASDHLMIDYSIPDGHKNDPMYAIFTVTNNSDQRLSTRHQLYCYVHRIVMNYGTSGLSNVVLLQNFPSGWTIANPDPDLHPTKESFPINPGGDATTDSCLAGIHPQYTFGCADIVLVFQYYLQSQPSTLQYNRLRIVTYGTGDGGFEWKRQSLNDPTDYCAQFSKLPVKPAGGPANHSE